ncbi:MAG: hypothetical protein WD010_05310 [Nitriliruptor sp.]|uniref:hypothetical protein n=1 Tax=Nitriliruptor sp. TaxID=2448056 RepID=UPI0034A0285C
MKNIAGIVGALLVLAVVLAIVSFLLDALRWLLIIAAVVLIAAALVGAVGKRGRGGDAG